MTEVPADDRPPLRRSAVLTLLEWAYALLVALAIVAVRVGADRWGWATILAYGPLALLLVPGLPLLAIGAWRRRRGTWLTVVALLAALFGALDLTVPWRPTTGGPTAVPLRLLELNANGGGEDAPPYDRARLAALTRRESPDVLALAEWPTDAPLPPSPTGRPWQSRRANDVLLASRFPIGRSATWLARSMGGEGTVVGCELHVAGRPTWCFALHLETPRRGFEPVLERKPGAWRTLALSIERRRALSAAASAFVRGTAGGEDCIVAGDFNEVPDGAIFRDTWGGWTDAFSRSGWGFGWTKWQDGWGARIDHVLVGGPWRAHACRVGPDVRSDHLPLLASLAR